MEIIITGLMLDVALKSPNFSTKKSGFLERVCLYWTRRVAASALLVYTSR